MANIIDYVKWRGDLELKVSEFNEIDSLILNRFSYFPLDSIMKENEIVSIKELSERFEKEDKNKMEILWKDDADLFPIMGKSKRFGEMIALEYINKIEPETEKQFSAITVILPDNTIYLSYRGTDNTLIGWKEDFNMIFKSHIASQISAKEYLENIAKKYPNKKIRIGGHSKGGNLAVYASIFADFEVKKRIINVYNNDGPGFNEDIINTEEYKKSIEKVITYIPQDSIFGMLLNHEEKYTVVQSTQKGVMEHDVYSWQVIGRNFVVLKEVTNGSKFIDKTITNWLKNLDLQTREQVIDIVFEIINSTEARTIADLKLSLMKNAKIILSSYKHIEPENKKMITATITALFGIVKENVKEEYKNNINKEKENLWKKTIN